MATDSPDVEDVRSLLFRETKLLDRGQYDRWLDLFTEDAVYWMPSEETEDLSFKKARSVVNRHQRTKESLEQFAGKRAMSERAWAFQGLKTDRFLSNVYLDGDVEIPTARAKWMLHLEQDDIQQFFAGDVTYRLRTVENELKISFKKVQVTNRRTVRGHLPLV